MHFSIDRTVHTTAFDKPVVDHWLERKIAQTAAGSTEKDRSDDQPLQRRARYRLSYIPLRHRQTVASDTGSILSSCMEIVRKFLPSQRPFVVKFINVIDMLGFV